MPELPDVDVYRRYMNRTSLHQPVASVHVLSPGVLQGTNAQGLGRALKGRSFTETCRHGKYLFATLAPETHLVLHFGMTGRLRYSRKAHEAHPHDAACFRFENGAMLEYIMPRKLGRLALTDSIGNFIGERRLGPDALAIDEAALAELAGGRRGQVKSWLMDQQAIAGIGNVYSDEILFQAGIHPECPVARLDEDDLHRLHGAIRSVSEAAIAAGAQPEEMPDDFLLPQRHAGGRCPRCGGEVEKKKAAGRTCWFCPRCQPAC